MTNDFLRRAEALVAQMGEDVARSREILGA